MVEVVGLLGSLGLSVPALGVRPFPFGTAIITSVGSFGLDLAFVPQTPFARVPLIFMVGAITPKAVAEKDPDTGALRVVAKETLTLTVTVDHRFLDGKDGAKMATMLTRFLEHPETLEEL
jgi:pyruvate dehydrogenase E2 component (dihydrolipoamide acetyltransferase)